ncbi:MAG: DMT family transporter, partial [Bacteroidaceae bacterium]|nr:DMT family transporter [Bacteroidaceae bacterium]
KKYSLRGNAVIPVLFLNTLFCSLIFLPFAFQTPFGGWEMQRYILLKSCIVLSSWLLGYIGIKHLPLTIVGPINATRPVMVLVGALLIFGEKLNLWQWAGVMLAILSFFLLSRSGKKEGIDFKHNRWILYTVGAAVLGAISGLYDKYLMATDGGLGLPRLTVQCWYNFYQTLMMGAMLLWLTRSKNNGSSFQWRWSILLISIFLSVADYVYFYSLSLDGALISVVSMVRRSSVVVSFMLGALLFHEKNLRSKAIDLALVLLSMFLLWLGQ